MPPTRLTTDGFIEKARAVHGDKYDYSQVAYVNGKEAIKIICPAHGEFEQVPHSHLSGCGCASCRGGHCLTTAEFITRARAIHGERYGYEQVHYQHLQKNILLICPVHGQFEQKPGNHLAGKGCLKCSGNKQLSTHEFIEKAIAVHGKSYNYSEVKYINAHQYVTIICPEHGAFNQSPKRHIAGIYGCSECAKKGVGIINRTGIVAFLQRAREVHGDIYDYSSITEFSTLKGKVPVICPIHGTFLQLAKSHLKYGCPKCARAKGGPGFRRSHWVENQKGRKAILYIITLHGNGETFYKIGITYRGVSARFRGCLPYQLQTVALYKSYDAGKVYDLEHRVHKELKTCSYTPILRFGGETECFFSILPALHLLPKETFFLKNRRMA